MPKLNPPKKKLEEDDSVNYNYKKDKNKNEKVLIMN